MHVLTGNHSDSNWAWQLGFPLVHAENDVIYYRKFEDDNGKKWDDWHKMKFSDVDTLKTEVANLKTEITNLKSKNTTSKNSLNSSFEGSITDLDIDVTTLENGHEYTYHTIPGTKNLPATYNETVVVKVFAHSNNWATMFIFPLASADADRSYMRVCDKKTWKSWKRINVT